MSVEINSAIVYVVDDELAIRDSMTFLLESVGINVRTFESAIDFLNNYAPTIPGCLILDVNMPFMNGLDLQEELNKRQINIPIIFISGNADIPASAKAFKAGALDFLEKPFEHKVLLELVEKAVNKDIENRDTFIRTEEIRSCYDKLTLREKQVLKLIVDHNSSKEVAKQLAISPRTIEAHRARIMEKMQADNIAGLLSKVYNHPALFEY